MGTICLYHSADFDGICSAAIVFNHYQRQGINIQLRGVNYGQPLPPNLEGNDVILVDFSYDFETMSRLKQLCKSFTWIDHHIGVIEDPLIAAIGINGLRKVGAAACELCWERLFGSSQPVPTAVTLLGRYDVWQETHPLWESHILPFQYGLRLRFLTPTDSIWAEFFYAPSSSEEIVNKIIRTGATILDYEKTQNKRYLSSWGFETSLNGHAAIACNRGSANSALFDSVGAVYPLLITFCMKSDGSWAVSLYSKQDINCCAIAQSFGGGGHRKAAGFSVKTLPFALGGKRLKHVE